MDWMTDSPDILREYLTYIETIMGRSRQTVNQYYLDLRIFFRFLLQKREIIDKNIDFDKIEIKNYIDIDFVKSVTKSELLDFQLFLSRQRPKHHKSPETSYGNDARARARKMSAINGFYKYCCDKKGYFPQNPTLGLDAPKQKKSLPKYLSLRESVDLLDAVDGPYAQRDYCIITLFLNCGMRVSELCGLNINDISDDQVRIVGKGNKERVVYLNDACKAAIEGYLPFRITPKNDSRSALFISREGNRINVQTVKWLVKKYLDKSGLSSKNLSVHKLRHTAATLMYQNNVDVRTLKEVLGHESLDTTMIYTHVIDENMKDAAKQNPLANVTKKNKEE